MQNDLYGLAIEVSTKCSLDISSVIAAWGLALIKTGEFTAAREKFATCFKVSFGLSHTHNAYTHAYT